MNNSNRIEINRSKKVLIIFICILLSTLFGENKSKIFLGVNPSITAEPYYEDGEFDINILPIVFQYNINEKYNFRVSSLLNYGIRKDSNQITHYGIEFGLPIEVYKQIYVSPIFMISRNDFEDHTNLTLAVEPGYQFKFKNNFSLFIGTQLGSTHFTYDNGESKWDGHFGVKVIIGKWFKQV